MLIVTSSYLKVKCTRALHIVHPDEFNSLTVTNGINAIICDSKLIIKAGNSILTEARWNEFDLIMVHGCNNKKIKDFLNRLKPFSERFKQVSNSKDKKLIFVDNAVTIISDNVLLIPRHGNMFINDLAKSVDVDIETNGLGLTTDKFDYDFEPKDVSDKYFRCLTYASMKTKIYLLDPKSVFVANNRKRILRGSVYMLDNNKLTKLSGKDGINIETLKSDMLSPKNIRPIRAIYKKEEQAEQKDLEELND